MIGAGFSSIASATLLAEKGHDVTILEKNEGPGGRARQFKAEGFTFDMGPSWYWMPDIFENYFERFGKKVADYYDLVRLDPSYRVYNGQDDSLDIPATREELYALFDKEEPGSSKHLKKFLADAKYKYEVGINEFVWKPGMSLKEFMDVRVFKSFFKLKMFSSISTEIRRLFKSPKLIKLLEFPVLFLGATPQKTPALYSLMNYADLELGTWYPMGGMHKIIEGMVDLAQEKGVKFKYNEAVTRINYTSDTVTNVITDINTYFVDYVISGADYEHTEQKLIPKEKRIYDKAYWDSRNMAPSSLLFYIGLNKKLEGIKHHTLFFDKNFEQHAQEIYTDPQWPSDPLFYVCAPSVTDSSVAPEGCENLFVLIPLAPDLEDSEEKRALYFDKVMERYERLIGTEVRKHIIYRRDFGVDNFKEDYNAFKGNAYGLANTLKQTAILKPKINHSILKNLYFTGQLTTPGPGVPPSLISGQMVAQEIINKLI